MDSAQEHFKQEPSARINFPAERLSASDLLKELHAALLELTRTKKQLAERDQLIADLQAKLAAHKAESDGIIAALTNANREAQRRAIESEHRAITDGLTGLYNRRYIDEHIKNRASQLARSGNGKRLAILMLDIDHFKRVNDTYGHDGGDEALRQVSALIKQTCRTSDISARWGGEEFLVVIETSSEEEPAILAEKIRKGLEMRVITHQGSPFHLTMSVGVAFGTLQELQHPEEIIQRADTALYEAKNGGRNKVVVSPRATEKAQRPADKRQKQETPSSIL
jgi:diguanylate cyclase (GGDEF)-like protein